MLFVKTLAVVASLAAQPVSIDRNALEIQSFNFHQPTFAEKAIEISELVNHAVDCVAKVVVTDARFHPDLSGMVLNVVIVERGEECSAEMRIMYDKYKVYFGRQSADDYFDKVFMDFLPHEVSDRIRAVHGF